MSKLFPVSCVEYCSNNSKQFHKINKELRELREKSVAGIRSILGYQQKLSTFDRGFPHSHYT